MRRKFLNLDVVIRFALWGLCPRPAWLWLAQYDIRVIAYDHHFSHVESQTGTIALSIDGSACGEAQQPPPSSLSTTANGVSCARVMAWNEFSRIGNPRLGTNDWTCESTENRKAPSARPGRPTQDYFSPSHHSHFASSHSTMHECKVWPAGDVDGP